MTWRDAPLPTVPLWLATLIAISGEAALLAGIHHWSTAQFTVPPVPELPLEVSLVAAPPVLTDAAVVSAASVPPPKSAPPPPPPVAEPEPPPMPMPIKPAVAASPAPSVPVQIKPVKPRKKPVVKKPKSPAVARPVAPAPQSAKSPARRATRATHPRRATASPAPIAAAPVTSSPAAYLSNPAPIYPTSARQQGVEGTVQLRVLVNASGQASVVQVARSAGANALDQAAVQAVRRWRFQPARRNGAAISAWVQVPIRFKLNR
ncbi:energy transducer TonB [Rhodoferax sp. 4810]|uniref:Protein TonB n=1 Tax=Thiospirillum jenense TaxID=1653858 RepID=A0A839HFG4_9GAMM|nr:energy transducer TonB [Rhodoferax jenense]MBB1126106.1 energy transducer TonB [Thiospirillum jenense]